MKKLLIALSFIAVACGGESTDPNEEINAPNEETVMDSVEVDTLLIDELALDLPPIDPNKSYKANILMETVYHAEEVMDNVNELDWWGVFKDPDGHCSLKQAKVIGRRVEDAVVDMEGEKTGWKISADEDRESVILINGLDFLKAGNVYTWLYDSKTLMPGEEETENVSGRQHRFYATGTIENDGYQDIIKDYKLHYEVIENGEMKTSTIDGLTYGYASLAEILFIGDIDMDGYFDIITNNTDHYNAFEPTLYLSRPSDEGELLKKVGSHRSVGC